VEGSDKISKVGTRRLFDSARGSVQCYLTREILTSYGMWNCLTRLHCRNIRTVARHVSSSDRSKSINVKL